MAQGGQSGSAQEKVQREEELGNMKGGTRNNQWQELTFKNSFSE